MYGADATGFKWNPDMKMVTEESCSQMETHSAGASVSEYSATVVYEMSEGKKRSKTYPMAYPTVSPAASWNSDQSSCWH